MPGAARERLWEGWERSTREMPAGKEGLPTPEMKGSPRAGSPHAAQGDGVSLPHFSSRAKTLNSLCICKIHGTKARGGEIIYYSLTVFLILNSFCQITSQRIPSSFQYLIFFFFTVHYTHSLNQICSTLEVIIRYSPRATIAEYIMGLCCGRKAEEREGELR